MYTIPNVFTNMIKFGGVIKLTKTPDKMKKDFIGKPPK
jgi:hypothetical protein